MRIRVRDLPASTLEILQQAQRQNGLGRGTALHPIGLRWQMLLGAAALILGVLLAAATFSLRESRGFWPWGFLVMGTCTALFLLYAAAAIRDHALRRHQGLDAFVLVTPVNLVRCWGPHLPIEIHRLRDATSFKIAREYDQRQKDKGRRYSFVFTKASVDFIVADDPAIDALDAVLELARAKGRGEALPDMPGTRVPDLMPPGPEAEEGVLARAFLNPRSEFWMIMAVLLAVGFLIGIVASRR